MGSKLLFSSACLVNATWNQGQLACRLYCLAHCGGWSLGLEEISRWTLAHGFCLSRPVVTADLQMFLEVSEDWRFELGGVPSRISGAAVQNLVECLN